MNYDVVVIGAGPGGYHAAIRAAQIGLRVAVVERDDGSGDGGGGLGGVCLNWGCIPSKSLLKNAELVDHLNHAAEWGLELSGFKADLGAAVERSRKVSKRLTNGIGSLLRKHKIELVKGAAVLDSATQVRVGDLVLDTKNIVVATGARARDLPGIEIDGETIITSRHALDLRQKPESLAIVGASAIGCEFAYYFNAYGVQVHLLEAEDRLVPKEDIDVSKWLARSFQKAGITIATGVKVSKVEKRAGKAVLTYTATDGGQTVECDKVLLGVGVKPNSDGIGLERLGVAVERGFIGVDGNLRTNVDGVYAVGDVTGKLPLAHVAFEQGIVAAETLGGRSPAPLNDYANMPRCTYCQPEIASLGLTEQQARDAGLDITVTKAPYGAAGKSVAIGEAGGFCKLVLDSATGELIGAHLIGASATELIAELGMLQFLEGGSIELGRMVHAHPTLSELLKEAGAAAQKEAIHF